jgi:hypothetical protein
LDGDSGSAFSRRVTTAVCTAAGSSAASTTR